jgi:hypothetical protein
VAAAGIGDIEDMLVGREAEAVRLGEVVDDHVELSRSRVEAIDVAAVLLRLGLVAFIVGKDAVGRVGEPDRAVGFDDDVVGRVQPPALVTVDDRRDRAVRLGPQNRAGPVRTGDQPALAVAGVAVDVVRRLAEDADAEVGHPAQQAVVRDVAPDQEAAVGEPDRPLAPAALVVDQLEIGDRDGKVVELLVDIFVRVADQCHGFPLDPPALRGRPAAISTAGEAGRQDP